MLASRIAASTVYGLSKETLIFGGSCGGGHAELDLAPGIGFDGSALTGVERAIKVRGSHYKHLVEFAGEAGCLKWPSMTLLPPMPGGRTLCSSF